MTGSRRFGIPPSTAQQQFQKVQETYPSEAFQPLPKPTGESPYRVTSAELGIPLAEGPRLFHVIGDSGGVANPTPQADVVAAMIADVKANPQVAFSWHVGDIAYYDGEWAAWLPQFYEAYAHYNRTIIGHPGNHDADPLPGAVSLTEWMAIMCSEKPTLLAGTEEYQRDTQTIPNVYFTLLDPAVTIIGLYTNVPSGGVIESDQAEWFQGELENAPKDLPLIVSLHHPPYSVDAYHGGSAKMGEVLDIAFEAANRWPTLVLTGHVHDLQRFTRTVSTGQKVTYIVCGNSGYRNLHSFANGTTPGMSLGNDVTFDYGDASNWGFLRLTIVGPDIRGEYVQVAKDGTVIPNADSFSIQ